MPPAPTRKGKEIPSISKEPPAPRVGLQITCNTMNLEIGDSDLIIGISQWYEIIKKILLEEGHVYLLENPDETLMNLPCMFDFLQETLLLAFSNQFEVAAQALDCVIQRQEAQQTLQTAVHQDLVSGMVTLKSHFQEYAKNSYNDSLTVDLIDIDSVVISNTIGDAINNIVDVVLEMLPSRLMARP